MVLFLGIFAMAQVPRFAKYDVAETSAQLYLPSVPTWEKSLSEDKSEIYLTSVIFGEVEYGAIVIRLAEETAKTNQNPEALMESYVHFLNDNVFKFTKKTDFNPEKLKNDIFNTYSSTFMVHYSHFFIYCYDNL